MYRLFRNNKDDLYLYIYCRKHSCNIDSIKKNMFMTYKDIYKLIDRKDKLISKINGTLGVIDMKSITQEQLEKLFKMCDDDIIKTIVDKLVNINDVDNNGYTILNHMINLSNIDIIKYILDNKNNLGLDMEHMSPDKWKYIHYICRSIKNPDLVKYIIDISTDLDSMTIDKFRPIFLIIRYSTDDIIRYIIDKGVNLEVETSLKWKPIHYLAKYNKSIDVHNKILDKDIDIECMIEAGWYLIHFLCRYSTKEIIELYIENGISLESKDFSGWNPMHYICKYQKDIEIFELFISKNVDIYAEDNNGFQPIHIACMYSSKEIIRLLVQNGCDIYVEARNRKMSIDILNNRFSNEEISDILAKN